MVVVVDVVTRVDDPPIAFVAIEEASCLTEVEQVIWNVHKDTAHCERQSIQVADSTLSILFVDEVHKAQVLWKEHFKRHTINTNILECNRNQHQQQLFTLVCDRARPHFFQRNGPRVEW